MWAHPSALCHSLSAAEPGPGGSGETLVDPGRSRRIQVDLGRSRAGKNLRAAPKPHTEPVTAQGPQRPTGHTFQEMISLIVNHSQQYLLIKQTQVFVKEKANFKQFFTIKPKPSGPWVANPTHVPGSQGGHIPLRWQDHRVGTFDGSELVPVFTSHMRKTRAWIAVTWSLS